MSHWVPLASIHYRVRKGYSQEQDVGKREAQLMSSPRHSQYGVVLRSTPNRIVPAAPSNKITINTVSTNH